MEDTIEEVGIDSESRLYIKPSSVKFPMMYREAIEVNWDNNSNRLLGGIPRKWSYLDWYKQIVKGAAIQGCSLKLTEQTSWVNIPNGLRLTIVGAHSASNT